jgi:hypothetical protein
VDEACSADEELRNSNKIFVGKPEMKRALGRHKLRWEDNIKIHLRGILFGVLIGFIWLRLGTDGLLVLTQ